jgi:hypothetical protein
MRSRRAASRSTHQALGSYCCGPAGNCSGPERIRPLPLGGFLLGFFAPFSGYRGFGKMPGRPGHLCQPSRRTVSPSLDKEDSFRPSAHGSRSTDTTFPSTSIRSLGPIMSGRPHLEAHLQFERRDGINWHDEFALLETRTKPLLAAGRSSSIALYSSTAFRQLAFAIAESNSATLTAL